MKRSIFKHFRHWSSRKRIVKKRIQNVFLNCKKQNLNMTKYLTQLISLIILISFKETQSVEWTAYKCDPEQIDMLNVSRLLLGNDNREKIYLILDNKIVEFKSPRVYDNDLKNIYYTTFMPVELNIKDKNGIGKIVGYNYEKIFSQNGASKFKLEEIYETDDYLDFVELDFNLIPGTRSKRIRNEPKVSDFTFQFTYKLLNGEKSKVIKFEYVNYDLKVSLNNQDSKTINGVFTLNYLVKFSVFYLNGSNPLGLLIELDTNNKIHLSNVYLKGSNFEFKSIRDDLNHFLNCHQPFKSPEFVKGIVYNEEADSFIVFIDKFYLTIKDDLIYTKFQTDYHCFEKNAFDIEILMHDSRNKIEIANTKKYSKIHNFWSGSYYQANDQLEDIFMKDLNHLFKIEMYNDSSIVKSKLKPIKLDREINRLLLLKEVNGCNGQIIELFANNDKLSLNYCFESNFYYLAATSHFNKTTNNSEHVKVYNRNRFPIENLFLEADFEYEDEKLEQIFFYKYNKIALMTLKYIYFLDLRLIKQNSSVASYLKITFNRPMNSTYNPNEAKDLEKPGFFIFQNAFFLVPLRPKKPLDSLDDVIYNRRLKIIIATIIFFVDVVILILMGFFFFILYRVKNFKIAFKYCCFSLLCIDINTIRSS